MPMRCIALLLLGLVGACRADSGLPAGAIADIAVGAASTLVWLVWLAYHLRKRGIVSFTVPAMPRMPTSEERTERKLNKAKAALAKKQEAINKLETGLAQKQAKKQAAAMGAQNETLLSTTQM